MDLLECFSELEMRIGTVLEAEEFPEARKPAYKLKIDFGPHGVLQSSAQITALYGAGELVGRQVVAVTNLSPRRIAGFVSECLVLGFQTTSTEVVLLEPERAVADGTRVS